MRNFISIFYVYVYNYIYICNSILPIQQCDFDVYQIMLEGGRVVIALTYFIASQPIDDYA